jgi:predicted dehydrogenase
VLKAAIVGMGRYAERLIAPAQGKSDKITFVAGATRDPANGKAFAQRHGLRLASDYGALLRDPEVQAVVLATPHALHAEQVQQAAAAGKHVFVEKPFTLTAASAREAAAACERHGVVLAVGFQSRFYPAIVEVQRMIAAGELGEIVHLEGQFSGPPASAEGRTTDHWRTRRADNPAGGMTGKGIHLVDLMLAFCGPIASVYARSDRRRLAWDVDDVTSMLFRFDSGATGYLSTLLATAAIWRLQVYGTRGWAEVREQTELTVKTLDGEISQRSFEEGGSRRAELEAFADAVLHGKPYPVTHAQAIASSATLEAIEHSASSRTEVSIT